jgi:hypothetical protein
MNLSVRLSLALSKDWRVFRAIVPLPSPLLEEREKSTSFQSAAEHSSKPPRSRPTLLNAS